MVKADSQDARRPYVIVAVVLGVALVVALGSYVLSTEHSWAESDASAVAVRVVARLLRTIGMATLIGFAFVGVVILQPEEAGARRALLVLAGIGAGVWTAASLLELCAVWRVVSGGDLSLGGFAAGVFRFAGTPPLGIALTIQAMLGLICGCLLLIGRSEKAAIAALVVAAAGSAFAAGSSHAASHGLHGLGTAGIVVHVLAAATWAGGLAAVLAILPRALNPVVLVQRFSAAAMTCAIAVGISGVVAALVLHDVGSLTGESYGRLLIAKTLAFAAVIGLAAWARRRLLVGRRAHSNLTVTPTRTRTAVVELAFMTVALGLAATLSQTPPFAPLLGEFVDPLTVPPSPTVLLGTFAPDPWGLLAALALAVPYAMGVLTLRRRGDSWSKRRSLAFFSGVALLLLVTCTGIGAYASILMSVHMIQHMTMNMVVPLLLVAGAPVTLLFRALPPVPRRLLLETTRSRAVEIIANPFIVTAVFVGSLYVVYFTPVFPWLMSGHWGHGLMLTHFLVSGFIFFWLVLAIDPHRGRPGAPAFIPLVALAVVGHTVFAVVLVFGRGVIGEAWFSQVTPEWGVDRLADQALAGGIAWGLGEFVMVGVLVVLVFRWFTASERAQRSLTR